jgi:HEPN domain-containing protein
MNEIDHARAMLRLAEKDQRALQGMLDKGVFAEEIFGFHAQQAVEKGLKAWIAALGKEYPLTHSIARLLAILQDLGADMEAFWELTDYTAYAVEFRYGGLHLAEEPLDRPAVLARVEELLTQVARIIEEKSDTP